MKFKGGKKKYRGPKKNSSNSMIGATLTTWTGPRPMIGLPF
jgi:hypothetical protein